MEFLKNHYEKLILGVVLLGLAAATFMVSRADAGGDEFGDSGFSTVVESKARPIDISTNEMALARFTNVASLNLEDEHYLFNPAVWQRRPDGSFITGHKLGPKGLVVKSVTPLKFVAMFADVNSGSTPRCTMRVTRVLPPGEKSGFPTMTSSTLMAVGDENDDFKFEEAQWDASPKAIVLTMKKNGEQVRLEQGKSFERIEGYMAELRYDVENKNFNKVREKSALVLTGETNNVVAVSPTEVVLVNPATSLRTTLKYNAAP